MRWNAFEQILPALELTKKRVLPFNFKEWFKLGIAGAISGNMTSNFNLSNPGSFGGNNLVDNENISSNITGAATGIKENIGLIGGILSFFLVIFVIWSYISSVFKFIFIESVLEKKTTYRFRKNMSKGTSLFLFNLVITIIIIAILAILFLPYIRAWINGNSIIESVGWAYIILSILIGVIFLIIIWFLLLFVNDFVTAFIYSKGTRAYYSWKQIWKIISKNKVETLVYWVARFVVEIIIGIISLAVFLLLLIIFIIIAAIILLIGYLIYLILGGAPLLIALGIIIAIILLILIIIIGITVSAPLPVFAKYFSLLNFEDLTKIKLIKKGGKKWL